MIHHRSSRAPSRLRRPSGAALYTPGDNSSARSAFEGADLLPLERVERAEDAERAESRAAVDRHADRQRCDREERVREDAVIVLGAPAQAHRAGGQTGQRLCGQYCREKGGRGGGGTDHSAHPP